jgi:flavin-dependent dehydrogenase
LSGQPIEIIGGGVAGLSLAIALRSRDVPVVVREAGSYPRHRLCGEFVNGVSPETLDTLGVESAFQEAVTHHEMSWWHRDSLIAKTALPQPVRALSRWSMDERLRECLERLGGEVNVSSRVPCEPQEGRVWTAGRRLVKDSQWLGLKAHFLGLEMNEGLEMHLGDGGYVGLTPVENGRVNVCGLFKQRGNLTGKGSARLQAYLQACGLSSLAARLHEVQADESSVTGVTGIAFGRQGQEEGLLCLGDAERMTPPFTGNGMSMAFESAECAFKPLVQYYHNRGDWSQTCDEIRSHLAQRFDRRLAFAKGMHQFILHNIGRQLFAVAGRPGFVPFALFNRLLT